jgi:hypothetical protein
MTNVLKTMTDNYKISVASAVKRYTAYLTAYIEHELAGTDGMFAHLDVMTYAQIEAINLVMEDFRSQGFTVSSSVPLANVCKISIQLPKPEVI